MTQPASADSLNHITSSVIECAIRIHRAVGPGLLESAYFGCLLFELSSHDLRIETQKSLPLIYHGTKIDCAYRADLSFAPIHSRQLLTYLRVANCPLGLLLNFGAATMREGIQRVINGCYQ